MLRARPLRRSPKAQSCGLTFRFMIAIRRTCAAWSAICRTDDPSGKMIRSTGSGAAPAVWAQTAAATATMRVRNHTT